MPHLIEVLQCQPACTDHCPVGKHIGHDSLLLHLIEELQGPVWHLALSACTDRRTVGDHTWLESLLPNLIEVLQGQPTAMITAL